MLYSSISHSRGVCELQSTSCRAAGASPGPGHSHLLLLPVPPHPGTAAPVPTQPHRGQVQGAHPKTPTLGSCAPWQNPVPLVCSLWHSLPRGKQDPQQVKTPTHMGERASHTHLARFHATAHNPNPATGLNSWLGNRTGSFSAKCKFYSNRMPIRVQENKSNKRLLQLGLVFLFTSYCQAYFNLLSLTLYWRNEPGKLFFKWEHENLMRDELSILYCTQL